MMQQERKEVFTFLKWEEEGGSGLTKTAVQYEKHFTVHVYPGLHDVTYMHPSALQCFLSHTVLSGSSG